MTTTAPAAGRKRPAKRKVKTAGKPAAKAGAQRSAPKAETKPKKALLPPAVSALARRRSAQLAGIALVALGLVFTLAIVSYNALDPSFNRAVDAEPKNWLGYVGSYSADILLQTLGVASLLLTLIMIVWGVRLAAERPVRHIMVRLVVLCAGIAFAIISLAGMSYLVPSLASGWPPDAGLGGYFGAALFGGTRELLAAWGAGLSNTLVTVISGILALAILLPVSAITWHEWRVFGGSVARRIRALLRGRRLGRRKPAVVQRPADAPRPATAPESSEPVVQKRVDADTEVSPESQARRAKARKAAKSERADAARAKGRPKPSVADDLVAEKAPRPAPGRRAQASRQGSLDLKDDTFKLPSLDFLQAPPTGQGDGVLDDGALAENARYLESVLQDFGIKGNIIKVRPGPVITLYELEPAPGTKSARVIALADDIARSMSAVSVRVAVIPGRNVIGIELPNATRETVFLRELLSADSFENASGRLPLMLGKNIGGSPVIADLAAMPHLLIAGTTGSGKSVGINTMILSLLYRLPPARCKFIMIDPKMLELSVYDGIPQLLAPVVTDPKKAIVALRWAVREMESRYQLMSKLGVRNIESFNKRVAESKAKGEVVTHKVQIGVDGDGKPKHEDQPLELEALPFIVLIVDELADLMLVAGKDIESAVQRLSQMARAAGIHLIMATQRPSVDVITGTIKANFPTRVSFQVTSKIDSRTILGEQGAEQLLGQGDMLYMAGGGRITRVHGPFVSEREVEQIVGHLKSQGEPSYLEQVTEEDEDESDDLLGPGGGDEEDDLYRKAVAIVLQEGKASTSFIQRRLQIGYNRAARLIERMEEEGIVSQANHAGKREILAGAGDY